MASDYAKQERLAFAQDCCNRLEELIRQNPGLQSININGTATTFTDLLKQRDYWLREISRLEGTSPTVKTIRLGGG